MQEVEAKLQEYDVNVPDEAKAHMLPCVLLIFLAQHLFLLET